MVPTTLTHNTPTLRQKRVGHEASTPSGEWGFLPIENRFNQIALYEFLAIISIGFIMNVNSTKYSPITRSLPGSITPNPPSRKLFSIRNAPTDFNIKPSFSASAKRVYTSVFRKVVNASQFILSEQVSQVSCHGKKENSQLDISDTGLMTKTPNTVNLFRYLDYLVKEKNIGCVELITKELVGQSSSDCIQMMNNLKGWYGQHILGVLNFAVEQVAQAEEDPLKLSNASKYPILLKELRRALQEKLEGYDGQISNGESIRFRYQLAPQDIEALSNLDINIYTQ